MVSKVKVVNVAYYTVMYVGDTDRPTVRVVRLKGYVSRPI